MHQKRLGTTGLDEGWLIRVQSGFKNVETLYRKTFLHTSQLSAACNKLLRTLCLLNASNGFIPFIHSNWCFIESSTSFPFPDLPDKLYVRESRTCPRLIDCWRKSNCANTMRLFKTLVLPIPFYSPFWTHTTVMHQQLLKQRWAVVSCYNRTLFK